MMYGPQARLESLMLSFRIFHERDNAPEVRIKGDELVITLIGENRHITGDDQTTLYQLGWSSSANNYDDIQTWYFDLSRPGGNSI